MKVRYKHKKAAKGAQSSRPTSNRLTDPTGTLPLRRRFTDELSRVWNVLRLAVNEWSDAARAAALEARQASAKAKGATVKLPGQGEKVNEGGFVRPTDRANAHEQAGLAVRRSAIGSFAWAGKHHRAAAEYHRRASLTSGPQEATLHRRAAALHDKAQQTNERASRLIESLSREPAVNYDPDEARDSSGRWTSGGGTATLAHPSSQGDDGASHRAVWETAEAHGVTLFHGTKDSALASIARHGLDVRYKSKGADAWAKENGLGDFTRFDAHFPGRKASIYLTDSKLTATQMATAAASLTHSRPVVLTVDIPQSQMSHLHLDELYGQGGQSYNTTAVRYEGRIPPNWIKHAEFVQQGLLPIIKKGTKIVDNSAYQVTDGEPVHRVYIVLLIADPDDAPTTNEFNPDEARDQSGKWTSGSGSDYIKNGVKAKSFKSWFGDWENPKAHAAGLVSKVVSSLTGRPLAQDPHKGSMVTDKDGKPLVVYHGTKADFSAFDPNHSNPSALLGRGFYFSESEQGAKEWGGGNAFQGDRGGKGPVKVLPVFLNIKHPFDADAHLANLVKNPGLAKFGYEFIGSALGGNDKATAYLKNLGFDGIVHMGKNVDGTPARVWIAFDPHQIKSLANRGTFSAKDDNIYNYSPDEQRDDHGRFADEGTTESTSKVEVGGFSYSSGGKQVSVPVVRFRQLTDPHQFNSLMSHSVRPENHTVHSEEELNSSRMFVSEDGEVGFMLTKDNDFCNLFNNGGPKGAGQAAIVAGIKMGAKTGDCYDGFLPRLYAQFGLKSVARLKFNDEYAPPGWDYAKLGRPDVVFLRYEGGDRESIQQRIGQFPEYRSGQGTEVVDFDAGKRLAASSVHNRATHSRRWVNGSLPESRSSGESVGVSRIPVVNASALACLDPKLWGRYLGQAYQQGVTRAFNEVHRSFQAQVTNQDGALVYHGARQQFTVNTMRSCASSTLNRIWTEYRQRGQQVLNALQSHLNNSSTLLDTSNHLTRAYNQLATLARLGVIRAHAEGQLDGYQALGIQRVKQVADKGGCLHLNNSVYNLAEALGSVPRHTMCRCAWLPADNTSKQPLAVNRLMSPLDAFSELLANYSSDL